MPAAVSGDARLADQAGEQQELPAAAARGQPRAVHFIGGEVLQPRRHFGQRRIPSRRAIGEVDRIEPPERDQHGVDLPAALQPLAQPRPRGIAARQAGHRIAAGIKIVGCKRSHESPL